MRQPAELVRLIAFLIGFALAGPAAAEQYEGMILSVTVNKVERGEFQVFLGPHGDFLVRRADAAELGIRDEVKLPITRVPGEDGDFVSLLGLRAREIALDTKRLSLSVELPPELFAKSRVDLGGKRRGIEISQAEHSAFLNYRLATTDSGNGVPVGNSLATEVGLRIGDILLRNEGQLAAGMRPQRFTTQAVYDLLGDQQRYVFGDHTAYSGELGSSVAVGGVNLSKVYQMSPNLIRQPLAGFSGVATSPSRVEVRVGGAPVTTAQVGPGPFELQNLRQFGGSREVEVVVRDALGREQTYTFPFYFSDQSLRAGLQEYSYSLGKLRVNPGADNDHYGPLAFSGYHRFGYSDALTLGGRAEAAPGLVNAGLDAIVRNDTLGLFSAALSAGARGAKRGVATQFSYAYQERSFGARAIARRFGPGYLPLEDLLSPFRRRADYGASLSWYLSGSSSLSMDRTVTAMRNQSANQASRLIYSRGLGPDSALAVTLQRVSNEAGRGSEIFFGFHFNLEHKQSVTLNANRDHSGSLNISSQLAQPVPQGEGLGYRLGWNNTRPQSMNQLAGYAQWNAPWASFTLDSMATRSADSHSGRTEAAVVGALAYADGSWGFSRQISESFAIVRIGDGLEGVRVQANSQEIGRSNAAGQVLVPAVGAFAESRISIDGRDIPLEYSLNRETRLIAPAYRSGVLVDFGIRRVHPVEGVIQMRSGAELKPAELQPVRLSRAGRTVNTTTGRQGYFYVEDLDAGDYLGEIEAGGQSCRFALRVPQSSDIVISLPGASVCE